jgi:hypothetical protein
MPAPLRSWSVRLNRCDVALCGCAWLCVSLVSSPPHARAHCFTRASDWPSRVFSLSLKHAPPQPCVLASAPCIATPHAAVTCTRLNRAAPPAAGDDTNSLCHNAQQRNTTCLCDHLQRTSPAATKRAPQRTHARAPSRTRSRELARARACRRLGVRGPRHGVGGEPVAQDAVHIVGRVCGLQPASAWRQHTTLLARATQAAAADTSTSTSLTPTPMCV